MAVELAAGDFLGIVVEQEGIDLVVEIRDPDGKTAVEVDGPDYGWWEEELAWVAERSGTHEVVVRALLPNAAPGTYRLRLNGPRAPRPEDQVRLQAAGEMREAHALIGQTGKDAERLGHLERALPLWQSLGERRREAEVLHQMGGRLFELHRHQESAERFHQAVAIWEELGLPDRRVWSLLEAGHADQILLREKEGLGHLEEGLAFARRTGIRALEVQALYLLGGFHEKSPRTAAGYLESALRLARDLGDELVEMRALHYLGNLYGDLAEPQEALRSYEEALELARRLQQPRLEAGTLNNMGLLYDDLGDMERAIRFYEQALAIRDMPEDFHAIVLNNQARAQERVAPARARELYERTLALCEKIGARKLQATALNNLALLDLSMGDASSSLRRSRQALELAAGVNQDVEIDVRRALGMAHRQLGDLESSRRELEAALALSRERQDRVRESQLIPLLARTARSAGDPRRALELLEQGVGILETIRAKVVDVELRTAFLASRQDIYELRTNTLMALHRAHPDEGYDARALRANEQARARGLIDILAEAGADDDDVDDALRASSPRYSGLTRSEPLSVDEIRREVLDGRALLLEYALGREGSFLWAVGPDSLRSFDLPPRKKIEKAARRWYDALKESKVSAEEAREAADELSAMLLGPVEGLLSGQPLLIVADGALQYLPFGALPIEQALLIDRHEVTSLPSASALAVLRRELAGRAKAPKLLAVLADPVFGLHDKRVDAATRGGEIDPRKLPRLRFSKDEAEAIAGLVPETQLYKVLGFDASRSAVVSGELFHYRMIHIAAHGLIDSRRPELSTIVLSLVDERGQPQNGLLRLHDIYNLELQADLVVLSACETALGQEIRGEGLVGLTRGFMYAGAARVLASLWSVDDRATSVLMKSFYGHMISGGMSPAAALRQTQSEMAHSSRWSSPYYWAGFSLQGEWR
ncbi:MAG TPA: CHAT domain-containing tetratricopeptide repeat protein [Thermoanaerobaculia bacterium]|nr:CHAT domain-containing tetratricopeptide repeat protein [Thermoanaerobaculia bacterium]